MNERIWQRHSNPWSGWSAVVTYPLVYLPFWNRSWRQAIPVAAWLTVNGVLFPPPKDDSAWMTRAILGEKMWLSQRRRDLPMLLTALQTAAALTTFTMAYKRRLWPMLGFGGSALLLKMWVLDRMVAYYDQHHGAGAGT